jgi:hypothetical protein
LFFRDYQLTPERYKDKHGSALLRKKMIECEVPGCHERIAHDFGKVGAHFSRVHPTIGLREYYEKYVTKIKVCSPLILLYPSRAPTQLGTG